MKENNVMLTLLVSFIALCFILIGYYYLPSTETVENQEDSKASSEESNSSDTEQNNDQSNQSSNSSDEMDTGQKVFEQNCLSCHGENGSGGDNGPNLQQLSMDEEDIIEQIKNGGTTMPAFEGNLSEDEINAVSSYLTEEVVDN